MRFCRANNLTLATSKFAILGLFVGTDDSPSNDTATATSANKNTTKQGLLALASTKLARFIHFSIKDKT